MLSAGSFDSKTIRSLLRFSLPTEISSDDDDDVELLALDVGCGCEKSCYKGQSCNADDRVRKSTFGTCPYVRTIV